MMTITPLLPEHWPVVKAIYEDGLATGQASFQTSAPGWEEWDKSHLIHSRLVAKNSGTIVGWVALSPVSGRCVYAGVAEVSIYIAAGHRGLGIGKTLLEALVEESEAHGIWTLQAGIFPENTPSLRLHEGAGFRQVGIRQRIGKMGDRWRDTVLLERRSEKVG
ncbi:GNAT family N-acetyltransferase [Dinghuibacter silviterrae]|uniref:Phosphinothricin acetyltransferase n=1 Tax=Dinghuibacter silviterrae TaxID=1539049 RepID=A0A4R8DMT9_9BACT|nr:GNAT family N-acetyltransferase [Dinghuibacter silviterrae]TDW99088.1 phosphinothricin acetyltransferase [Dinghuibacter silviterrae]